MTILKVDYPAVLTLAGWDKNKGVGAKLSVGKTDVGANLTLVAQAFKTGGFADVKEFGGLDPIEYAAWEAGLVAGLRKGAVAVGHALDNLNVAATAAHTAFVNSKLTTKASVAYVKSILDQITPFKNLVTQYPDAVGQSILKAYRTKLRDPSNTSYLLTTKSGNSCGTVSAKIVLMIKEVEASPTVAKLHAVFGDDGPHRMLTTAFKAWDQLAKGKYPKLAAKHYGGTAMTEFFTLRHLEDMGNENQGDASKKLALLVTAGQNERQVVNKFCLEYSMSVLKCATFLKAFKAFASELEAA